MLIGCMDRFYGAVTTRAGRRDTGAHKIFAGMLLDPQYAASSVLLLLILGAFSQLLLGCGTLKTNSNKAPGIDLSQYHTFDFAQTKEPSGLRFFTPKNEARLKAAIQLELEKRGLRRAGPGDLSFCMYLKTKTKTLDRSNPVIASGSLGADLSAYYGLLYDNSWGTQNLVAYPVGTLVVQAVDVKQNRKVWEGIATGVLYRDLTDKQIEARIHEAVSGMFKNFPER